MMDITSINFPRQVVAPTMEQMETKVREARQTDIPRVTAIYNQEVSEGMSNYESKPHTEAEREQWLAGLQSRNFPVLVAEREGRLVGFAALTPFHPLSGYRFTVSGSVYVDKECRASGVGRALVTELKTKALERGYHCVLAGVNSTNVASIRLLETLGFKQAGYFREIGFKNGQWFDDVCLQLHLATPSE